MQINKKIFYGGIALISGFVAIYFAHLSDINHTGYMSWQMYIAYISGVVFIASYYLASKSYWEEDEIKLITDFNKLSK